jgi:hypothetical protein
VEPVGPMMLDFYRLYRRAGDDGLVTWASVRCELQHQAHKSFFVPAKKLKTLLNL